MAASEKDTEAKKVIDVARPGKTAPDATARPIIVTHKPIVKDPTVKTEDTETKPAASSASRNKIIKPLSETSEASQKESSAEDAAEKPDNQTEPKAADDSAQEAAVIDAVAGQADLGPKNNDPKAEEEKKRQEQVDKLTEEKKYFVPIGQVSKRRNRRLSLVFLLLLLLIAGGYLALDAGLIKTSIQLPIDIIKT